MTFSQADVSEFESRDKFFEAVCEALNDSAKSPVLHWAYSRKYHKNSEFHYHMCVKLERQQRWLTIKNCLQNNFGIMVHYSSKYCNYFSAWSYTAVL